MGAEQQDNQTENHEVGISGRTDADEGELSSTPPAGGDDGQPDWFRSKANVVDGILDSIENQLTTQEFKATISDFIRLLQLRKELEEERPREITVTWVEPSGMENAPAI